MITPLIPLIVAALAGFGVYSWYSGKKRRELLFAWAVGQGWRLHPGTRDRLHHDYPLLNLFNKGHSRRAKNVISGEHQGRETLLMDYTYVTGNGKNRSTHNIGVALMQTEFRVMPLTIRRENPMDKVGEFFGADDIDFESAEFSRKFYVKCGDRKWAYDVIHQRTMDFLLAGPAYEISFGFQEIAVSKRGHFSPDEYEKALALAWGLYSLIPDYVIQQMKGTAR